MVFATPSGINLATYNIDYQQAVDAGVSRKPARLLKRNPSQLCLVFLYQIRWASERITDPKSYAVIRAMGLTTTGKHNWASHQGFCNRKWANTKKTSESAFIFLRLANRS